MENGKSVQPVIRNLKDAGCSRRDIEQFLALYQADRTQEQLALLALHRQKLLDKFMRKKNGSTVWIIWSTSSGSSRQDDDCI